MSEKRETDFSVFDNWERDESIPLSERVLATYDYLGICGANWNPGEVRKFEDENAALKRENEALRKYADHKGYCRARLRELGDACICGLSLIHI